MITGFCSRRTALLRLAIAAAMTGEFSASATGATADPALNGWPTRPVRVFLPSSAGSQTDLFGRFVVDQLGNTFGQPFIVINKPGASGSIAAVQTTHSAPDGYTLLFSATSFTVVPAAVENLPYKLIPDLVPIVQIGAGGNFIAVPADSKITSLKGLFDQARAQPGAMPFGTTGVGSLPHIVMMALLKSQAVRMVHVPYKSGADVLRDLMAGLLPVGWVDTTSGGQAAQAGKIRLLAVSGTFRMPNNPEVQTLVEQGYPIEQNGWLGLFAPKGTPGAIVRVINAETNKVMVSADARQRLRFMNVANFPANTPDEFARTVQADLQAWHKIVVDNGITAQ